MVKQTLIVPLSFDGSEYSSSFGELEEEIAPMRKKVMGLNLGSVMSEHKISKKEAELTARGKPLKVDFACIELDDFRASKEFFAGHEIAHLKQFVQEHIPNVAFDLGSSTFVWLFLGFEPLMDKSFLLCKR